MKRKIYAVLAMAAMLFAGCAGKSNETKQVSTDGSTSMEKVIGSLGEAFGQAHSDITFTYNPTGSGAGIAAVTEGRCDIGLSSRLLKEEEKSKGLKETVLAYDGISIVVNPENSVNDLSVEDIAAIYTGEIHNWSELGGENAEIVVIGREAGSGTRDGFETVMEVKDKCVYRQELTATGDVITTVAGNPAAIGYASMAAVGDNVKELAVEGVLPSEESVKDGRYKVQRPFILVTREKESLSASAQEFFDFALSDEVDEIIAAQGAVPAD